LQQQHEHHTTARDGGQDVLLREEVMKVVS
jgi:hypothetical protein